jgi:hypothetical protein
VFAGATRAFLVDVPSGRCGKIDLAEFLQFTKAYFVFLAKDIHFSGWNGRSGRC